MTITVKVVADSVSMYGIRVTTLQCRYPRFIHSEVMTHRVFSRNASSSRAIPVERLILDVMMDPAIPLHWGANKKGMQADEELDHLLTLPWPALREDADYLKRGAYSYRREEAWTEARDRAIDIAKAFTLSGYHKQIVNRLLEPFAHINVLITSTRWKNFLDLRDHKDAQPEIRVLAQAVRDALERSDPMLTLQWHLPYLDSDSVALSVADQIKVSVARCARVSYLTQDGKKSKVEDDLKLYERLLGASPLHASPGEHQAYPDQYVNAQWANPNLHGNLIGWIQYRKTLPNEVAHDPNEAPTTFFT